MLAWFQKQMSKNYATRIKNKAISPYKRKWKGTKEAEQVNQDNKNPKITLHFESNHVI